MQHLYAVEVTELAQSGEPGAPEKRIQFEFQTHDDLLDVIHHVQEKQLFSEEQTKAFCIGMKMFTGILLENRAHPLFAEFTPHFVEFMKKVKKYPAPASNEVKQV